MLCNIIPKIFDNKSDALPRGPDKRNKIEHFLIDLISNKNPHEYQSDH